MGQAPLSGILGRAHRQVNADRKRDEAGLVVCHPVPLIIRSGARVAGIAVRISDWQGDETEETHEDEK